MSALRIRAMKSRIPVTPRQQLYKTPRVLTASGAFILSIVNSDALIKIIYLFAVFFRAYRAGAVYKHASGLYIITAVIQDFF